MTEVVYYVASSLDGFIAPPDGSVAWLSPFEGAGEDHGYREFYAGVDVILIGRRTYQQALTFGDWVYPGKPCWVFTRGALASPRDDVRITDQPPARVVRGLAEAGHRRAWLVGGGELAGAFRAANLIDEYVLSHVPVLLGAGIPLFGAGGGAIERVHMVGSRTFATGIVQTRYRRESER
jgi:dihydrofolate reductase